jgi:hypothetical protein
VQKAPGQIVLSESFLGVLKHYLMRIQGALKTLIGMAIPSVALCDPASCSQAQDYAELSSVNTFCVAKEKGPG